MEKCYIYFAACISLIIKVGLEVTFPDFGRKETYQNMGVIG
jgi:hypothetical protein